MTDAPHLVDGYLRAEIVASRMCPVCGDACYSRPQLVTPTKYMFRCLDERCRCSQGWSDYESFYETYVLGIGLELEGTR